LAKKDVAAQIMKNPKASTLQLKVGLIYAFYNHMILDCKLILNLFQIGEVGDPETSQAPFEGVVAIHQLLGNSDWLRYYRRDILRPICSNRTKKRGMLVTSLSMTFFNGTS
jgi:hypothetical protein